jgi:hypothetical protein
MTTFIDKYEAGRKEMNDKNQALESSIVALLEGISRSINREQNMPSLDNFQQMQDALQYKETQLTAAQSTTQKLQEGYVNYFRDSKQPIRT